MAKAIVDVFETVQIEKQNTKAVVVILMRTSKRES